MSEKKSRVAICNSQSAFRNSGLLLMAMIFTSAFWGPSIANGQKSGELNGTSWRLVKLEAADETTLVPDDGSKYTIKFGRDGRATVRVDCNHGGSTWRSTRPGELQFGSWSMTRAKCAAGSLHDRIVTEGASVRSYVIKNGHLLLSGMAAGGSYELEPLTIPKRRR